MRKNLNVIAAYSIMMGLIILVGIFQSWNIALSIFNLCLISAVMTMGANIQWGYAGLINFGIMGFTALGGLNNPENLNTNTFARRAGLFANLITGELIEPSKNPLKLLGAYLQEDTIYGTMAYDRNTHQSAWRDVAEAAERHNQPGEFTTFIAYEFTSSGPGQSNLHRNVIFKGSKLSLIHI